MNGIIGIEPKLVKTKIRVSTAQIGMISTILPAEVIGSAENDRPGCVTLVIEAPGLKEAEYSTLDIEIENGKTTLSIKPLQ